MMTLNDKQRIKGDHNSLLWVQEELNNSSSIINSKLSTRLKFYKQHADYSLHSLQCK